VVAAIVFLLPRAAVCDTLSLHDALPILRRPRGVQLTEAGQALLRHADAIATRVQAAVADLDALVQMRAGTVRLAVFPSAGAHLRSEEHTSELQSRENLVCRLLLEKKKTT